MSVRGYRDEGFGKTVKWDVPLISGYDFEFLSTDPSINRVGFRSPSGAGIGRALAAFGPDVLLLSAYNAVFHLRALRAARQVGAAVVMRHEASDVAFSRSKWKATVRDRILRMIYSKVDRFAAIGTNAEKHLRRLGVASDRIGRAPYCVDSDFVGEQVERWVPRRDALRAEFGITPGDVAFVFSGKLIPKKDPLLVAAALGQLPHEALARIHLIIAGDGDLRAALEAALLSVIGTRVHFLGFLNQSEMGRAYGAADYLVLPSRQGAGETWGLVVNEAMQFGLPVIVSDAVGCHPDLIRSGETGWVFPAGNEEALSKTLYLAVEIPVARREKMVASVRQHVGTHSLEAAVEGLGEALHSVTR